jgi:polysaccharide deacetylase family protein (PEP-CTERM system associated)
MFNALTVDVEDYYHVAAFESVIRFEDWERFESRVENNTYRILEILEAHKTQATFFVLGWVAERHPQLVRAISACGHEVASHGYAHQRLYNQTPEQFRTETRRSKCILEDAIGQAILGYRAASYSVTAKSLWALAILREEGFAYDSSIFPIHHDLYGIPSAPRFCHVLQGPDCGGLVEFPLSTLRVGSVNLPIAGGGYFRLFPYTFTRWGIRRLNKHEHQSAVVYLHPWEIDPCQPRIPVGGRARLRHYLNLSRTAARLHRLLQDLRFGTMADVLRERGLLATKAEQCACHLNHGVK